MIETPSCNLSRGMRHLNGVYTQRYNRRHGCVGHLFQGRFKAILVEKESYLLQLSRYIVRNTLAANLTKSVADWKWSSYRPTAGLSEKPKLLTVDWILQQFSPNFETAQALYRDFVTGDSDNESPWLNLVGQIYLGSEGFAERTKPNFDEAEGKTEIPKIERLAVRPGLNRLLASDFSTRQQKDAVIYQCFRDYGYTQKQIADYLGVHYATVSRAIKRVERGNA